MINGFLESAIPVTFFDVDSMSFQTLSSFYIIVWHLHISGYSILHVYIQFRQSKRKFLLELSTHTSVSTRLSSGHLLCQNRAVTLSRYRLLL